MKRNQLLNQQTCCNHVFSFSIQDGDYVFKCESCSLVQRYTDDSKFMGLPYDNDLIVGDWQTFNVELVEVV